MILALCVMVLAIILHDASTLRQLPFQTKPINASISDPPHVQSFSTGGLKQGRGSMSPMAINKAGCFALRTQAREERKTKKTTTHATQVDVEVLRYRGY